MPCYNTYHLCYLTSQRKHKPVSRKFWWNAKSISSIYISASHEITLRRNTSYIVSIIRNALHCHVMIHLIALTFLCLLLLQHPCMYHSPFQESLKRTVSLLMYGWRLFMIYAIVAHNVLCCKVMHTFLWCCVPWFHQCYYLFLEVPSLLESVLVSRHYLQCCNDVLQLFWTRYQLTFSNMILFLVITMNVCRCTYVQLSDQHDSY